MSASQPRRRLARAALAVAVAVVVLAGCAGQKDATSYTKSVQKDFVSGCWTQHVADAHHITYLATDSRTKREAKAAKVAAKGEVKADTSSCACIYAVIAKDVKFHDFSKYNDSLREKPGPLPAAFVKAYNTKKCAFTSF